ncbi:MAG: hypothetical protein DRH08_05845 [Deltaproteobacteria bacterium]|nr:MAG: hypothetical protein DRH08_05845 [Deltaproteobacteria bacterium]
MLTHNDLKQHVEFNRLMHEAAYSELHRYAEEHGRRLTIDYVTLLVNEQYCAATHAAARAIYLEENPPHPDMVANPNTLSDVSSVFHLK